MITVKVISHKSSFLLSILSQTKNIEFIWKIKKKHTNVDYEGSRLIKTNLRVSSKNRKYTNTWKDFFEENLTFKNYTQKTILRLLIMNILHMPQSFQRNAKKCEKKLVS